MDYVDRGAADYRGDQADYEDYYEQAFSWPTQFCGDEGPLWPAVSDNSSSPSFVPSLCFQHTVLAPLAPLLLLLSLPFVRHQIRVARADSSRPPLPFDALASLRQTISLVLIALKALLLASSCFEWLWLDRPVPLVELLYPVLQLASLILLCHLSERCRLAGLVSPGPVFCVWLLFVLSGFPEFLYWLNLPADPGDVLFLRRFCALFWWPLCCVQLLFHCFAGSHPLEPESKLFPEERASFLSRQAFLWFDPLVRLGHKRPLAESDLYQLGPELRAQRLFQRWTREWARLIDGKSGQRRRALAAGRDKRAGEKTRLLPANQQQQMDGKNNSNNAAMAYGTSGDGRARNGRSLSGGGKPEAEGDKLSEASVVLCLWRLFRWEVVGAMMAKLASDLLQFASPLLLGQLIAFTEDQSRPGWFGFALAGALFLASEMRSLFMNNYFAVMNSIGCQAQSVLTSAVYAKTLRLSATARRGKTSGQIANLMAIDVDRFQQVIPLLQQIWSSPLQVVISLLLLYQTVGWAFVGGVAIMVALIPINLAVIRHSKRWQIEQMSCKDHRLRLTSEVLSGIRAIKLYAWEVPMTEAIERIRRTEVKLLRQASLLRICSEVLNITSPFLVAIVSFSLYTLPDPVNHPLTPEVAFVSLTLFSQLRIPMMVLAELIGQMVQTAVSNRRLREFLAAEEIDPDVVDRDLDPDYERAVDVEFASFSWDSPDSDRPAAGGYSPPTLSNLELHIKAGLLVAVLGRVGAGKSSLISALMGEMHKLHGYVGLRGRVAYVSQQPWILNRSIRENILFLPLHSDEVPDEQLYSEVVQACALQADFAVLPDGDRTEIGERGINLSGGQKARVSLARALYRRADVYLLDDPLSAVDAIVGRHLFERAIGPVGMMAGSTRILVTHSQTFLPQCDWVVVLEDGQLKRQGTYQELVREPEVAQLMATLKQEEGEEEEEMEEDDSSEQEEEEREAAEGQQEMGQGGEQTDDTPPRGRIVRLISRSSSKPSTKRSKAALQGPSPSPQNNAVDWGKLVREETAETGHVKAAVYKQYFAAMGWPLFSGFCLFTLAHFAFSLMQQFWLSSWSDDNSAAAASAGPKTSLGVRLGVYALQGVLLIIFLGISNIFQILGSVSASVRLHGPLLARVLHAPVSFFDTTPLGRVLNRFGKEFDTVDLRLASAFRMLVLSLMMLLQVLLIVSISLPPFLILILPVALLYSVVLRFFIPTSRQLQRLSSVSRSPLYNLFAETINGTSSIRAYGVQQGFFDNFSAKLDVQIGCRYFSLIGNRWLSIRLELLGNLVILCTAVLAVFSRNWGTATAGLIGLAVSKCLDITYMLAFLVRNINDVELSVVSVERIMEYNECPQEANWHSAPGEEPLQDWPQQGAVSFQCFSCRHRPELEPALRCISADILPLEKVGIVGRTGAGKTSLASALFRILEAEEGRILIDGVDISQVGLHELRSRITVIPQDPVLFSGTLRFNLDPFNAYTDADLWTALEHVNLKAFVESQRDRLSCEIAEGGENISVGQRQLLCLARAILRRSALVVLDEATASIDAHSDSLIQMTIRTEFKQATILTIAHRISTVMDYDRIMVLSDGRLIEFDTPANLMANKRSYFYGLVNTNNANE